MSRKLAACHQTTHGLVTDLSDGQAGRRGAYKNNLKQHLLVHLHELLVPFVDVGGLLAAVGVVFAGGHGVALVVFAPFQDFAKDYFADLMVCGSGG